MTKKYREYNELLLEQLQDPELALTYLNEALHDEDQRVFLLALKHVLEAQGGDMESTIKLLMSVKKQKSTYTTHIESMTPEQKQKFDEGYKDLLFSEMLLAVAAGDHIAAQRLAELAGISLASPE